VAGLAAAEADAARPAKGSTACGRDLGRLALAEYLHGVQLRIKVLGFAGGRPTTVGLGPLASSVFLGWLTLRSGSVWPAVIAHGVNNANATVVYWFFSGPMDPLIGPSITGVVGSLGYVVLALLIFFYPHALAPTANQRSGG
jgi:hypothetical protein